MGVGEGFEDLGVGVVELDTGGVEGEEEGEDGGGSREVVGDLAVVDADR